MGASGQRIFTAFLARLLDLRAGRFFSDAAWRRRCSSQTSSWKTLEWREFFRWSRCCLIHALSSLAFSRAVFCNSLLISESFVAPIITLAPKLAGKGDIHYWAGKGDIHYCNEHYTSTAAITMAWVVSSQGERRSSDEPAWPSQSPTRFAAWWRYRLDNGLPRQNGGGISGRDPNFATKDGGAPAKS